MERKGRIGVGEAEEIGVYPRLPALRADDEVEEFAGILAGEEHGELREDESEECGNTDDIEHDKMRDDENDLRNQKCDRRECQEARWLRRILGVKADWILGVGRQHSGGLIRGRGFFHGE
jgi:hypothetical protein